MWQPPERLRERGESPNALQGLYGCLEALARCLCCLEPDGGEGGQRLLSPGGGESHLSIEASASPPPRLPSSSAQGAAIKGQGASSSGLQPAASPPMPQPFFPPPPRPKRRPGGGAGGGSTGGSSSPEGGSPKAAAAAAGGKQHRKFGSKASLLDEDEEVCPTCLDPYTEDNPRVLTRCAHHFHLPCLYEWLERSETCPVCSMPMQFDEIV